MFSYIKTAQQYLQRGGYTPTSDGVRLNLPHISFSSLRPRAAHPGECFGPIGNESM